MSLSGHLLILEGNCNRKEEQVTNNHFIFKFKLIMKNPAPLSFCIDIPFGGFPNKFEFIFDI
jgi:hypothetical protein